MKKGIKILILAWVYLISKDVKAQADSSLNGELRRLLINLNRAPCLSPFLFDMAAHSTNDTFYRVISNDTSDANNWLSLYFEFNAMSYSPGIIPSDDQIANDISAVNKFFNVVSQDSVQTRKVPVGLMDFDFNSIRPDAFDSANMGRWYFWNNDSIWDNPARISDPFEINPENPLRGTCREIFAFSPLVESHPFRNVTFVIDPSKFIFYNNPLYSTNVLNYPSPHLFQIDFDDGGGFRNVDPYNYSEINVIYPTKGVFHPKAQVLMDGNVIKFSLSTFEILSNDLEKLPDLVYNFPDLWVGVYKGCSSDTLLKPIIYVSGIDILEDRFIPDIYHDMILDSRQNELLPMLKNFDYDFVIVDWKDSKVDMRDNAMALVSLIDFLKKRSDSTHQFIVIGESMGGVVSRFALTYMETSTYLNSGSNADKLEFKRWRSHNTRLFISFDSPHQGAVVPLAYQHATDWIYRVPRPLIRTVFFIYKMFKQADIQRNVMQTDAVKQLLILHRDTRNASAEYTNHSLRDDFMSDLVALNSSTGGWPAHCKLMGISNGLFDGSAQVGYKDSVIQPNDVIINMNMFIGVKIFKFIPVPVFAMDNSKLRINPTGSGNVVELGWRYNAGVTATSLASMPYGFIWSLRGCLINIFKKKTSPCNILGVGIPFTVDVNNAEPCERFPGGTEAGFDNFTATPVHKDVKKWFYKRYVDYDPFNGTITTRNSYGIRFLLAGNYNLNAWSNVPRFCFIPMQSALDYIGLDGSGNRLPQTLNLSVISVDTNMFRTPFDIIMGWNTHATYPGTIRNLFSNGFLDANGTHLSFRNEPINLYGSEPANFGIINREIGDRHLYLDNLNINREALFQTSDFISAGLSESKYYLYPNKSPLTFGMTILGLNSDSGRFFIDSFKTKGQVEFRAGNEIRLEPGFHARHNSKFLAHIQQMDTCEFTLTQIQEMGLTSTENTDVEQLVSGDNILTLYPNPSESFVYIKSSTQVPMTGYILDLNGRRLGNGNMVDNKLQFNVENLAKGVYICIIECESVLYRFKIIKQ